MQRFVSLLKARGRTILTPEHFLRSTCLDQPSATHCLPACLPAAHTHPSPGHKGTRSRKAQGPLTFCNE